jgi:hypothetical protein
MIENPGRAGVWSQQTSRHQQRGGLPGTVRPDQPEHATATHFKIEMINGPLESE